MRILFLADGRSPIALNWIQYFCEIGDDVHLVSLYPCKPSLPLKTCKVISLPGLGAQGGQAGSEGQGFLRRLLPVGMRTAIRQRIAPLGIARSARELEAWIEKIHPELIHAMRIPYEGMLAAVAHLNAPLVVSVWGNDFTLHAPATRQMGLLTRKTLNRASALHTDCERDRRMAFTWGFDPQKLSVVLPGAGGVRMDIFKPPETGLRENSPPTMINPRGMRAYVRNDIFFRAVALVRARLANLRVVCPAMQGEQRAQEWVREYALEDVVELLPRQSPNEMAELFRRAWVAVSLTEHDGTPNTLLEAMACGCFPVAGDLESVREWITPGVNGMLVPPDNAEAAAQAIQEALENAELRSKAGGINRELIDKRANYQVVMEKAREFYQRVGSGAAGSEK